METSKMPKTMQHRDREIVTKNMNTLKTFTHLQLGQQRTKISTNKRYVQTNSDINKKTMQHRDREIVTRDSISGGYMENILLLLCRSIGHEQSIQREC